MSIGRVLYQITSNDDVAYFRPIHRRQLIDVQLIPFDVYKALEPGLNKQLPRLNLFRRHKEEPNITDEAVYPLLPDLPSLLLVINYDS